MATARGDGVVIEGIPDLDDAMEVLKIKSLQAAFVFVTGAAEIVNKRATDYFIGGGESLAVDTWRSDAWPIPTNRSGFLSNSIRSSRPVEVPGGWYVETGPRTVYGRRVELGYTGTGRWPYFTTRPFPFLKPALEDSERDIADLWESTVEKAQEA